MESNQQTSIKKEKILITTISNKNKTPKNTEKKLSGTITARTDPKFLFPKLAYTTFSPNQRNNYSNLQTTYSNYKKIKNSQIEIGLKKMELFIRPVNRSEKEINNLREIKKNLVKKRFNELHKYKLQINPNNYYRNYGLNNYIIITNNNSNKKSYSHDYQYNNISSYNNIALKDEDKKMSLHLNKNKFYKDIKKSNCKKNLCLLKSVPFRAKSKRNDDHIINSFNDDEILKNNNSLWRGKNINDIIRNKTNINFFKNFIKNSKNMGKIKINY